jgi:hypothetical protein
MRIINKYNYIFRMEKTEFQKCMESITTLHKHNILTYQQWDDIRSNLIQYYLKEGYEYAT